MKKLMVLAAVAAIGAMSAKAAWTVVCDNGEGRKEFQVSQANVRPGIFFEGFDGSSYNQLYLMNASDWDGKVASLEKSLLQTTLEDYDEGWHNSKTVTLQGDQTVLLDSGYLNEDETGHFFGGYVGIYTDESKSGYFVAYDASGNLDLYEGGDVEFLFEGGGGWKSESDLQSFAAESVPEPTSGLLLLLGVAGLALKRKRA